MAAALVGTGGLSASLSTTDSSPVVTLVVGAIRRRLDRRPAFADLSMIAAGLGSMAAAGTLGVAAEMAASIEGAGSMSGAAALSVSDDEECAALSLLYLLDLAA